MRKVRFLSFVLLVPLEALARPPSATAMRAKSEETKACSIGAPNEGRLDGGLYLGKASYLRVVPFYVASDARWGLPDLVGLVDRAGKRVARDFPGAVLSVGDMSRKGGGELDRHRSHESGRDVDLGFYMTSDRGKALLTDRFLSFRADGSAPSMPGAHFDDARNWVLVSALLDDPEARVTQIFVSTSIRSRLLRHAAQVGAGAERIKRAAETMVQPRSCPPHDDHFHVRIGCPKLSRSTCVEQVLYLPHEDKAVRAAVRSANVTAAPTRSLAKLPHISAEEPTEEPSEEP